MRFREDDGLEAMPEPNRRREVTEMHLFNENASEEESLCGTDVPDRDRRSVTGYLEDRLSELRVATTCEGGQGTGDLVRPDHRPGIGS